MRWACFVAFSYSSSLAVLSPPNCRRRQIGASTSIATFGRCSLSIAELATGRKSKRGGCGSIARRMRLRAATTGVVIVPGRAPRATSYSRIAGLDADSVMPPKGERLTAEQVGIMRAWIDQGADWPGNADSGDRRDWWSLKPLHRPAMPKLSPNDEARVRNPIDRFILAKLREKGLAPSPKPIAARSSAGFISTSSACRRRRKRSTHSSRTHRPTLMNSWSIACSQARTTANAGRRHWLDVVHYGDTHGYDKDQPRPNAWPYRDYVIRAFNTDKPYSRFVEEQIAGDVLFPGTRDGITALGFIAAGPWDLIGHAEVPGIEDRRQGRSPSRPRRHGGEQRLTRSPA